MLNVPFEKMSFRCCSVRLQGWWIGLSWSVFGSQADGSGGASHVAYWAEPMVVLGGLLSHLPRSRKKTFNWARCAMISCRCQRSIFRCKQTLLVSWSFSRQETTKNDVETVSRCLEIFQAETSQSKRQDTNRRTSLQTSCRSLDDPRSVKAKHVKHLFFSKNGCTVTVSLTRAIQNPEKNL